MLGCSEQCISSLWRERNAFVCMVRNDITCAADAGRRGSAREWEWHPLAPGRPTEAQGSPGRPREAQGSPGRPREAQGGPERPREAQERPRGQDWPKQVRKCPFGSCFANGIFRPAESRKIATQKLAKVTKINESPRTYEGKSQEKTVGFR